MKSSGQPDNSENKCGCGRPTAGAPLCPKCVRTLEYALVNLRAHLPDLDTVAARQTRYGDGTATKGSIGKAQPLPVDMRFVSVSAKETGGAALAPGARLRTDARRLLQGAAIRLKQDRSTELPRLADLPAVVRYLARQNVHLTLWAPRFLTELRDVERRLMRMIDRPADRVYIGKCSVQLSGEMAEERGPRCPVELYAVMGETQATCAYCGTVHDVAYRRDVLLQDSRGQWVTATTAAHALIAWTDYDGTEAKLVDRIRKWRDRGRLDVQDVTSLQGKDRHLYRLGDVQDLLVGDAQSAQSRRIGVA